MAAEEEPPTDSARLCARHIAQAFVDYNAEFRAITQKIFVAFSVEWEHNG